MVRTQGLEEATHALPHGSVSEAVKLVTEIQRTDVCLHATLTGTSSATQLVGWSQVRPGPQAAFLPPGSDSKVKSYQDGRAGPSLELKHGSNTAQPQNP